MSRPTRLIFPAILVAILALVPGACTKTPAPEQRVAQLEATVLSLEQELEQLRRATLFAPPPEVIPATAAVSTVPADVINKIRDEGLNRSQVMPTLSYLTDVIGPRLTGSPNLKRANEWTRDKLTSWGLVNAHLDAWGPFGKGWSLKRFSAQVVEPQTIPLTAWPRAWSPGFEQPVTANLVWMDVKTQADLDKFKGKLKGAIVMVGAIRETPARFEAPATRVSDPDLLQMANAGAGGSSSPGRGRGISRSERQAMLGQSGFGRRLIDGAGTQPSTTQSSTTQASSTSRPSTRPATQPSSERVLAFLMKEGAAAMLTPSTRGDGGTLFVAQAMLPYVDWRGATSRPSIWAVDAAPTLPQVMLAAEDFNRLARMIQAGEKPRIEIDLRVQHHAEDLMAYNTIAEIPGTDLKDEIVMLGAHLDSWHAGTGATDNATGCAAVMEAVRIIKALNLKPRRTIRIALWTGEEQGLYGSKAYVAKHLGHYPTTNPTTAPVTRPIVASIQPSTTQSTSRPASRTLVRLPAYEKFSVYFNLDNGTGKIRGVYMQQNEAVRPIFRAWLAPFADLGASTLTMNNTGGTDHQAFDAIGLPGFQFIQDPVEYWSRTHHSNADVYDRAQADDLKQASTILAAFAYQAAMADQKLPRKQR